MYMIFAGYNFYPSGGWHDYKGTYDTRDEAFEGLIKSIDPMGDIWWHLVQLGEIVPDDFGQRIAKLELAPAT